MALCSQSDLEALRQIDVTAEPDPTITALIAHAEGILEGLTHRRFDPVTDYDLAIEDAQYLDGTIFLEHYPVTAVTVTLPDATTTDNFHLHPDGRLSIMGVGTGVYTWDWQYHLPRGGLPFLPGTVITYDGGFDDPDEVPQDLRTLCAQILVSLFDQGAMTAAAGPGVRSEGLGGWNISYDIGEDDLTKAQMAVVRRYRHKLPLVAI